MSIKGNVGLNVTNVLTTDTTLIDLSVLPGSPDRIAITAASLHNTTASPVVVQVYVSPDLTSASGDEVDYISVAANSTADIAGIISQGIATSENIIAKAGVVGCNAFLTIVEYTGGV